MTATSDGLNSRLPAPTAPLRLCTPAVNRSLSNGFDRIPVQHVLVAAVAAAAALHKEQLRRGGGQGFTCMAREDGRAAGAASERWRWMQAARRAGQQQAADRPRTVPAAPQLLHPHTCRATPKRPMKGMEATPAFETPEGVKKVAMTA